MTLRESWILAKACFHVLKEDKEMLIYPAIIAAIILTLIITFILSLFYNVIMFILLLFSIPLLVVLFSFLGTFFEAAVVGCAGIRLEGGNPRARDGFNIAAKRWWLLFKWALINIAIGLMLGVIRGLSKRTTRTYRLKMPPIRFMESLGMGQFYSQQNIAEGSWSIGDIIAIILRTAWSVASFFVIPIIVNEGLHPLKAIRRSWEIIKRFWKETLILKLGFKALFALLSLLGLIPLFAGFYLSIRVLPEPISFECMGGTITTSTVLVNPVAPILGTAAAVIYWVVLACLSFVMTGILRAVLYKYSLSASAKGERACPSCRSKIADGDALFCPYCGGKLPEWMMIPERNDEFKYISIFLRSYV